MKLLQADRTSGARFEEKRGSSRTLFVLSYLHTFVRDTIRASLCFKEREKFKGLKDSRWLSEEYSRLPSIVRRSIGWYSSVVPRASFVSQRVESYTVLPKSIKLCYFSRHLEKQNVSFKIIKHIIKQNVLVKITTKFCNVGLYGIMSKIIGLATKWN